MHWADPTTLVLIRGLAERGALAPLLLLITARPEFRPPWGMRSHHATISLAPLDRSQVQNMVAELSARHPLSNQIVDGVTERTGGVPLFIEEVTRLLLERGEQSGIQAIPPTLQQSLMARLDRLGPAREVAQIGAVIGRDFSYALLRAAAGMDDAALQTTLDRLAEADILLMQGLPPQSQYRFKHALIQDAAYENLLRTRRQVLHRRIGEVLRDQLVARAAAEPELLAHHFSQAGLPEAAIEWWGKAGRRSLERSALVEATEHLTRALDQIASLPSTPALRREEIKLQVALANALMHTKGYAAPETKSAIEQARLFIERAETLGEPPEDPLLLFSTLYGVWASNFVAFNGQMCRDLAEQFLMLAGKKKATVPVLLAHRIMGHTLLTTGELKNAKACYDNGIALYNPDEHQSLAMRFGQDIQVSILCWRSLAFWLLGYAEAALRDADDAVNYGRETGQAASLMMALFLTAIVQILCGNYSVATAQAHELFGLGQEKGAAFWKASGMMYEGCVLAATGNAAEAIEMLTSGAIEYRSTGSSLILWWSCHIWPPPTVSWTNGMRRSAALAK